MEILIKLYNNTKDSNEYIPITPNKILSIDIYHEENTYSVCKISAIINKITDKSMFSRASLIDCTNNKIIFNGQVEEMTPIKNNIFQILLIAKPQNPKEEILKLYKNYTNNLDKLDQNITELFVTKHDQDSIEKNLQQVSSSTIFCNPVTHEIKLSPITSGEKIKLQNILSNFSIKQRPTISSINLNINFNWIWNGFLIKDIYEEIAKFFDGKTISADNLIDKFTKIKQKFKHKNIDIICSKLFKIKNNIVPKQICNKIFNINESTVYGEFKIKIHKDIKIYDNFSINILNSKSNTTNKPKKISINLNSLASLKYPNWQPFKQYFENDTVHVDHEIFKAKKDHISDENFNKNYWIKEENQVFPFSFDEPFFTSEYGKKAILQAIKIAKSYIDFHNRNINILFKIPLKNGIFLTTDQVAEIQQKNIEGKITKIHNKLSWDEEFCEILIKTNSNFKLTPQKNSSENIDISNKTENLDNLFITGNKLINSVNITNNFTKQSELLSHHFHDINEFKNRLDSANTDISFAIAPITSKNSVKNTATAKNILY